ncbi:hypothetical protein MNBD_ACTINO02-3264 [hydrothermal vent metagenome]|uniref:Uncharacterized protein n=1 Tax=hydrothermal vent metagenome TaxID=652676 RepID=A0A3B0SUY8_9ZZZZ
MKRFWVTHARTFSDVVTTARTVLRDLELDDVPAALRPVERYSGGTLPPPLAGTLLNALVENEWFRSQVADRGPYDDVVVQAFVEQPPGWWEAVVTRIVDSQVASSADEAKSHADRLAAATAQLAEAKRRIDQLRQDHTAAERAERADDKLEALQRRVRDLEREAAGHAGAVDKVAAALASARDEVAVLLNERDTAKSDVRALKSERATLLRRVEQGGVERDRTDPVRFARELDQLVALARSVGSSGPGSSSDSAGDSGADAHALPPGVRPDDAAAVAWLLDHASGTQWVIDGYNLSFALGKAMADPAEARREVERRLAKLARLAGSGAVLVVFDSALQGERAVRSGRLVDVFFAPSHQSADDAIVERAADPGTIVVSNDRELRERSEAKGALVLWSDALVAWLG